MKSSALYVANCMSELFLAFGHKSVPLIRVPSTKNSHRTHKLNSLRELKLKKLPTGDQIMSLLKCKKDDFKMSRAIKVKLPNP